MGAIPGVGSCSVAPTRGISWFSEGKENSIYVYYISS